MSVRIKNKYDTAANWTSNDPTLLVGEIGYESDTGKFKIGDGITTWSALTYFKTEDEFIDWTNATADLLTTGTGTFGNITDNGLNASQAIMTDASKQLVSVDYLDQAVKTTSSPTFSEVTLTSPSLGQYLFTGRGNDPLILQQTDSARRCQLELFGSQASLQEVAFKLIGEGSLSDLSTFSMLYFFQSGSSGQPYRISTLANGSPTASLDLVIAANSTTSNQLYLATNGRVGIGTSSPSVTLDVNGSIKATDGYLYSIFSGYTLSCYPFGMTSTTSSFFLRCSGGQFTFFASQSDTDLEFSFVGTTHTGLLRWAEDEDYFEFFDDIFLDSSESLMLGSTATRITYGLSGDLDIYTPSNQTLKLQTPVYKDINMGGAVLAGVPGQEPGRDEFVDSAGTDTGIDTYAIAVGEGIGGSFELQHDYDEGSDIQMHVHWQGISAPTGTDNVRWKLTYSIARNDTVLDPATSIEIESAFDTQYEFIRSDFAAITGTSLLIGDQFLFKLERISSTGDAYTGDALIATVGCHYQVDTLGSRQLSDK